MLEEFKNVYQHEGEPKRRWFSDEYFDLIVWYTESNSIFGFQLCYDKQRNQRAVTWKYPSLYFHMRVDDGENQPGHYKSTPILVPDGTFDYKGIAELFKKESLHIEPHITEVVYERVINYKGD
jgi:hypothetical protein